MAIYKAAESISERDHSLETVFLAGSIDMNMAINWQNYCEEELGDLYNVLNPRREEWNSEWKQEIENPNFKEQVEWELKGLEEASVIILFFDKATKSPISLLEFGLYARSGKLMVVCEDGFWRKGNVDIVCNRYGIKQFNSLDEIIQKLRKNEHKKY